MSKATTIIQLLVHKVVAILFHHATNRSWKHSAYREVVQYILDLIQCNLKEISTFDHASTRRKKTHVDNRQYDMKHFMVKKNWPSFSVFTGCAMNTFVPFDGGGFLWCMIFFIRKSVLKTIKFWPIAKFAKLNRECKDMLQNNSETSCRYSLIIKWY